MRKLEIWSRVVVGDPPIIELEDGEEVISLEYLRTVDHNRTYAVVGTRPIPRSQLTDEQLDMLAGH